MHQILSLPGFDAEWYERTYGDVALSGLSPIDHYRKIGARLGRPPRPDCAEPVQADHAVIVHVFHLETLPELAEALRRFPPWIDVYVSYPKGAPSYFTAELRRQLPQGELIAVENRGQDIGAFFELLRRIDTGRYEFFCKLHSKKGDKYPSIWREALLAGVAGSAARISAFAKAFRSEAQILLGGADELFLNGDDFLFENKELIQSLGASLGLSPQAAGAWGFFAGTMFWLRRSLAEEMLRALPPGVFKAGPQKRDGPGRDGQAAHALERLFGLLPQQRGGMIAFGSALSPETGLDLRPAASPGRPLAPMRDILADLHQRRLGAENRKLLAGERPGLGFARAAAPPLGAPRDYTILTPTGDRFAEFARCAAMVARQSLLPRQWIVVDDGKVALTERMPLPEGVTYIRRPPLPEDPPHSLARNLLSALPEIGCQKVLIFEDDDWYSPLYAEFMLPLLDHHDLVGLNEIRYYHLTGRAWKNGHPPAHTALAQTGFRLGPAAEALARTCALPHPEIREMGLVDRHWWHGFDGAKLLVQEDLGLHIGFKGGFGGGRGRPGLASGHQRSEIDYIPDPEAARLEQLLGADLPNYARWGSASQAPLVVYTALLSGQTAPPPPLGLRGAVFIALTDRPEDLPQPWQALPLDPPAASLAHRGRDLRPLWALLLPHLLFPEYELSLWLPPIPAGLAGAPQADLSAARRLAETLPLVLSEEAKGAAWLFRQHHAPELIAQTLPLWAKALAEGWQETEVIAALRRGG